MLGKEEHARVAATFIRQNESQAPRILLAAAQSIIDGRRPPSVSVHIEKDAKAVAHLRVLLKARPKSAILWVELARHQAALGETEKAQKSMQIALGLAPDHRWVLRSANRLLLHAGNEEAAHRLLVKHPRTPHDPWLMSAELASALIAHKEPKFIRQAKDMLRHRSLHASHLSELAAAVATIELETGAGKNARKLLRQALIDPTENALAQIEWADRESHDGLALEPIVRRMPDAYEATCWVKYNDGQIEDALTAAQEWLQDEPFANRPVGMVCYLAAFLDDFDLIIKTAREALERDSEQVLHRNNLIYALLSKGQILRAPDDGELYKLIDFLKRRIADKDSDVSHPLADVGLLLYRIGRFQEGRKMYEISMSVAEKRGNYLGRALAATMNSREAILFQTAWAKEALNEAHKAAKRVVSPGITFYLRKLDALIGAPDKVSKILSPKNAAKWGTPEPFRNAVKDLRIVHTESGPELWVPEHLMKR